MPAALLGVSSKARLGCHKPAIYKWDVYGISMEYLSILLNYRVVMQISILMFFFADEFCQRSQKLNWCETPGPPIDRDPACPCSMLLDSNEKYPNHKFRIIITSYVAVSLI